MSSRAFELEIGASGLATLTFDLRDKKVNVFTRSVLTELEQRIDEAGRASEIRCLVLRSGKPDNFIAGADVDGISGVTDPLEAEAGARFGQRLYTAWESLPFPTVAAIRATCVGGGTEFALACDYILVSDRADLRLGLPEVKLGIIPGWGGCTRLPARVGLEAALDLILTGRLISGRKAHSIGLADALLPDPGFEHGVRDHALRLIAGHQLKANGREGLRRLALEKTPVGRRILFDQARKRLLKKTGGHYPAPLRAIEVVRTGLENGHAAGLNAEARAIGELAVSPVCKHLIHLFQLMEGAKRDPSALRFEPIRQAAVVGAGVMGGGIAHLIADRLRVPVRLKDIDHPPLASAMSHADALLKKQVKRRRISGSDAKEKLQLILPSLENTGFSRADLVIEAIVEDLELKKRVLSDLARRTPDSAILASNTSSLSISKIAEDIPSPERVVGMHFFNPVEKMPLVEIVVGERTDDATAETIAALARQLGKIPVTVKDGPGFLVNRLLTFYMVESLWLLEEGHRVEEIDRSMSEWGMPLGPLALADEVGLDVSTKVAQILHEAFPERLPLPDWAKRLTDERRLGKKSGRGVYLYKDGERRSVDSAIYELIQGQKRKKPELEMSLAERMVLPMVNEAARCLDEEIVSDAGSLDLAMIMGTGFPPFRGGLCRWADEYGLDALVAMLSRLATGNDARHTPSRALIETAESGGFYKRFSAP